LLLHVRDTSQECGGRGKCFGDGSGVPAKKAESGSISYLIADNGQELPVFVGSGSSHVGDVTEEVSFRAELGSSMAGLPGSRDKLMHDSSR
jgi:hypothetical protein